MKTLREMMDMIDGKSGLPLEFTPDELDTIREMGELGADSYAIAHMIGNCTVADIDELLGRKHEYDDYDDYDDYQDEGDDEEK